MSFQLIIPRPAIHPSTEDLWWLLFFLPFLILAISATRISWKICPANLSKPTDLIILGTLSAPITVNKEEDRVSSRDADWALSLSEQSDYHYFVQRRRGRFPKGIGSGLIGT